MPIAEGYYKIGEMAKGNEIYTRMIDILNEQLELLLFFSR